VTWLARTGARAWRAPALASSPVEFHRALPGYRPTPLVETPRLAGELGVARVLVKDESARLGLPAFKILGASWAIERALARYGGQTLVAATDGNHGRAVARVAAARGLAARIFVPSGVHPRAVDAIADEGATIVRVDGSYDDAVGRADADARRTGALLVQDMAWPGYEQIPGWIVEGYTTMFAEIEEQLGRCDLVVVPVGVGSLAQAAIAYYRRPGVRHAPALLSVEPDRAACALRSLERDELITIDTSATIMAGLNCGTPSAAAWPYLRSGLDAATAVTDAEAAGAVADLAECGVPAGPCGAAALAGARVALAQASRRAHLGVTGSSTVVLLSTEGAAANPMEVS
jgi:diaminopropionate ammonia-lyase